MDFELTYTKVGDYYIPDLILDEGPVTEKFYGKYGDLRRAYLQDHKPKLWMVQDAEVAEQAAKIVRDSKIKA